jgi:competence protein ComEA
MRTRDREQDWIEELGRRRLEALIAELTPPSGPGPTAVSSTRRAADAGDPDEGGPVEHDEDAPGRHARRALSPVGRVRGWVTDRVPEAVRARGLQQGLQQGHVGVLALVLAVAVLLGGWAWLRASGEAPSAAAAPVVTATGRASASSGAPGAAAPTGSPELLTSPSPTPASDEAEVVVHVAGRVRRPGIVVLPTGSRVVDAVRHAGGFAPGVGPRSAALNLARVLVDGEQIVVGGAGQSAPGGPAPAAGPTAGATTEPMVSLNTADQPALESLPGVGPVTAAAILQWRSEHGPFTAVGQLLEVSGIGEATLKGPPLSAQRLAVREEGSRSAGRLD